MNRSRMLDARLIAGGAHFSRECGHTADEIRAAGLPVAFKAAAVPCSDTPAGVAAAMGRAVSLFAVAYSKIKPDIILVLGDRFEMHAAVSAAMPFSVPVAHIHGGEVTIGAVDNQFRNSISKMSHLHFVATRDARNRLIHMGEEPRRVFITGAPGLDNLRTSDMLSRAEFMSRVGMPCGIDRFLLVTLHPTTLDAGGNAENPSELLAALDALALPVLFTCPNVDAGRSEIVRAIQAYVRRHKDSRIERNLGGGLYAPAMKHAACMVGNSSSGIIEAASMRCPVVNVGDRQKGRLRGRNVIDVPCRRAAIIAAVRRAVSSRFLARVRSAVNPYGDGHAADRIVKILETARLGPDLIRKV